MKFSDQRFFYYEEGFWQGNTLADMFRNSRPSSAGLFNISGLADLRDAMLIIDEWYHQHPIVSFKELRRSTGDNPISVDDLDHEPENARREYNREIKIRAKPTQDPSEFALGKMGNLLKQNVGVHVGLLQLVHTDWWPAVGDQLWYMGRLHDVRSVHAEPSAYWQHSGVPMHLLIKTEIAHYESEAPLHALDKRTKNAQPEMFVPNPIPL